MRMKSTVSLSQEEKKNLHMIMKSTIHYYKKTKTLQYILQYFVITRKQISFSCDDEMVDLIITRKKKYRMGRF